MQAMGLGQATGLGLKNTMRFGVVSLAFIGTISAAHADQVPPTDKPSDKSSDKKANTKASKKTQPAQPIHLPSRLSIRIWTNQGELIGHLYSKPCKTAVTCPTSTTRRWKF
ncbi:hypothetical protein [Faucicola atlantae]|uniref:hypothetical protein n=1 Tax=Faucicola atlantae TaxID=34059 RepID=UPI0025B0D0F3|nr:hypothetical protein [Moraxella atlantae]